MNKLIRKSLSVAAVSLFSASAFSQGYIGGSVGQTDYSSDFDTATSIELKGGYKFNENFGLELAYVDLGEADFEDINGNVSVDGFKASVVGFIPVAETVSLYGKVGLYTWDADFETSLGSASDDDSDIAYGIGAAWGVADNLDVNFGYDIYDFEDDEATNINLGLTYKF